MLPWGTYGYRAGHCDDVADLHCYHDATHGTTNPTGPGVPGALAESAESIRVSTEYDFYKTQYEVLKSRTMAAWIIQEQHLETSPVFTVKGADKGIVAKAWGHVQGGLMGLGTTSGFAPISPQPKEGHLSEVKAELIDAYLAMLEVQPTRQTQLVKIAFHTPDPQLSARLADAHAEAYIKRGIELRTRANEEAQRFLGKNWWS